MNALQYLVVFDWDAFAPLSKHLMERYGVGVSERLGQLPVAGEETGKHMQTREQGGGH